MQRRQLFVGLSHRPSICLGLCACREPAHPGPHIDVNRGFRSVCACHCERVKPSSAMCVCVVFWDSADRLLCVCLCVFLCVWDGYMLWQQSVVYSVALQMWAEARRWRDERVMIKPGRNEGWAMVRRVCVCVRVCVGGWVWEPGEDAEEWDKVAGTATE